MHGTQIVLDGVIVRRSRNLCGMRDYARVSPVVKVETRKRRGHEKDPAGVMLVTYANGATCQGEFNSHAIMIDFVRNCRTWRNAEFVHHDGDMGYLTKPGMIIWE